MSVYSGIGGSVIAGTALVGEISEWSFTGSKDAIETPAFGQTDREYVYGQGNATGSFSGRFDDTDGGQDYVISNMQGGTAVALKLYMDADSYINIGTAIVTGFNPSISVDGVAETSYDFQVSGAWSIT